MKQPKCWKASPLWRHYLGPSRNLSSPTKDCVPQEKFTRGKFTLKSLYLGFIYCKYHKISWRFTVFSLWWDRTSACKGASSSHYQSIFDPPHLPTQPKHMYERGTDHNTPPPPTLYEQWVDSLTSHRLNEHSRVVRRGLRFVLLIREDLKV